MKPSRPTPSAAAAPALVLALLAGVGCHKGKAPEAAAPLLPAVVRVAPAGPAGETPLFEEVMGTVRARRHASVEARVTARVESLPVVPGTRVAAGDLLAGLDARDLRARVEQAMAQRDRAAADLERLVRLARDGAVAPQDVDAVRERQRVAAAAVAEAETAMAHARVVAPFDGVVTRKLAEVGDLATPGRALVEVEELASLRLEVEVPEGLVGRVPVGARIPVRVGPERLPVEGTVGEVGPVADPASRTHLVKVDLAASPALRPGQFARALVPAGTNPSPFVPAAALVRRGQVEMVFVATNGRAGLRLVRSGRVVDGAVEVLSGIAPGEAVVSDGAAGLVDGQPVEVRR